MVRLFSLLGVVVLVGCSSEADRLPYAWPTPTYGVPWTATTFTVRYSEWWNTQDEVRKTIADLCGPTFDAARVFPTSNEGSAMHPQALRVECGRTPAPGPGFRGQAIAESRIMLLKP